MTLPVLKSKLVSERVAIEFNFASQLDIGVEIFDPDVEVSVLSGIDPDPDKLLSPRRFLNSPAVFQWVLGGVPGVIYTLTCTVQSSTGKPYQLQRKLAILPSVFLRPPLFGDRYSTTPYPAEFEDLMRQSGRPLNGSTFGIVLEQMLSSGVLLSGQLRSPLQTYSGPPEFIANQGNPLSGAIRTILLNYASPPENMSNLGVPVSGTIRVILITYSNWPAENMSNTGQVLQGTLS